MPNHVRSGLLVAATALSLLPALAVQAQNYPTKPVRLITPFPPGGTTDILARIVATKLSEAWGQQVFVDNRGGAGGTVGVGLAARAEPDGHTILIAHIGPLAMAPALYPKLAYDPVKDFAAITQIASVPNGFVVHPSLPVRSVKELVALARARPGQMSFASAGNGQGSHLAGEMFKSLAGIELIHVPYKGAGPALADVLAGHASILFNDPVSAMPHIKAGRLKLLAVGTAQRSAAVPDTPTVAESGVPGFDAYAGLGILAPAGLPTDIAAKLHREIIKAMNAPEIKERFFSASGGIEPIGANPEQSVVFIRSEMTKWAKVVKDAGVKGD